MQLDVQSRVLAQCIMAVTSRVSTHPALVGADVSDAQLAGFLSSGNLMMTPGLDLRELTEELVRSLMESGGDSSAAYVRVERDSAAARFLVRSRVAQFHPKDATRLRLIDFGGELDD